MQTFKSLRNLPVFLAAVMGILLATGCGSLAEKLVQEGNSAFEKNDYLGALKDYEAAQIEDPELAEPFYNAANTYYRNGQFAESQDEFQKAIELSQKDELVENSYFNSGNSLYNQQEWEAAINAYKEALIVNSTDKDAKYNLELALQQLNQQQEQEQNQQNNQEKINQDQKQNQDQNKPNQNQSQKENQDQDEQKQELNQDQNQEQSQNKQNQESEGKDSEAQEKQNNQNSDQSDQSDSEDNDQKQNNSNEGQDQSKDNQNSDSEQNNENETLGQIQQNSSQSPDHTLAPGQRMTAEQAKQLLAAINQNMVTLQQRLGQILFSRELPPLQDW